MKAWAAGVAIAGWLFGARVANAQYPGSAPQKESAEPNDAEADVEDVDRLDGDRLLERFPSLRTRAEPRVIQGSLGLTQKILYLWAGIEGTLDAYPLPWLRLGFVYAAGIAPKGTPDGTVDIAFAQYGEAELGFRLGSVLSKADADLQLRRSLGNYGEAVPRWIRPRQGDFADVVPVRLPSSHQVFVEGGALTGFTGFQTCMEHCAVGDSQPALYRDLSRQVIVPLAGLRYVYYSEATMVTPHVNRVHYGQVFAHLLFHAFNQPREAAYFWSGDRVKRSNFGVKVGGVLPLSPLCIAALLGGSCAQAGLAVGYTPFPSFVSLEFDLRLPIR